MKRALLAGLSLVAFSVVQASAADLPVKARPMPAVAEAVWNWTGFYIGGHVGGLWNRTTITDVNAYAALALPGTQTASNGTGFFGGGQIGFNWQAGNFVFGIEGDGGWMNLKKSVLLTGTANGTTVGLNNAAYGDITGRLGLSWDRSLIYVKGGWAILQDPVSFVAGAGASFGGISTNSTVGGWVLGGGWEYKFAPSWSAKVEYLHYQFNSMNYTVRNAVGTPFVFNQRLAVDTVSLGINFHFNAGPVMARY